MVNNSVDHHLKKQLIPKRQLSKISVSNNDIVVPKPVCSWRHNNGIISYVIFPNQLHNPQQQQNMAIFKEACISFWLESNYDSECVHDRQGLEWDGPGIRERPSSYTLCKKWL